MALHAVVIDGCRCRQYEARSMVLLKICGVSTYVEIPAMKHGPAAHSGVPVRQRRRRPTECSKQSVDRL